jgi:aryl-alcohol dehydrogenase-like predicted oxidoreductase
MEYRKLGNSDINASVLCLGTWQFGDGLNTYQKTDEKTQYEIIQRALDLGINFFDTAEAYNDGESETALGKALKKVNKSRKEYYIATKISPDHLTSEETIRKCCEQSLKNLELEYIDLYQIHWPNHDIDLKTPLKTLKALQKEGKIRHIGISNFGVQDMKKCYQAAKEVGVNIITNQLPYSLLHRAIEYEILDDCVEYGYSIMAYSALAQGILTGKYKTLEDLQSNEGLQATRYFENKEKNRKGCEKDIVKCLEKLFEICDENKVEMADLVLHWSLKQKGITTLIIGASRPDQLDKNFEALSIKLKNEKEIFKLMEEVSEPVKQYLGKNPDLWEDESRYR